MSLKNFKNFSQNFSFFDPQQFFLSLSLSLTLIFTGCGSINFVAMPNLTKKNFKLRKVNHTLGDHRSGRAWDSNHGPNETDGRHLSKKPKNLRKKLPKKKNEKFSEKIKKPNKKIERNIWSDPCLCP